MAFGLISDYLPISLCLHRKDVRCEYVCVSCAVEIKAIITSITGERDVWDDGGEYRSR